MRFLFLHLTFPSTLALADVFRRHAIRRRQRMSILPALSALCTNALAGNPSEFFRI